MLVFFCGFFRCFRRLAFSLILFFTLITFHKKENVVTLQTGVRFFGRPKTNYIIVKHVYRRDELFLVAPYKFWFWTSADWLFRMRDDVLLLHSWDIFHSVHEHDFESWRQKRFSLKLVNALCGKVSQQISTFYRISFMQRSRVNMTIAQLTASLSVR